MNALHAVYLAGIGLATLLLLVALVVGKLASTRLGGRRSRSRRIGLRSLGGLVLATALIGSASEVRQDGMRPGWRARVVGWQVGSYVDLSEVNIRVSFGEGDPRIGLESSWWSSGRAVVYLGRELGVSTSTSGRGR